MLTISDNKAVVDGHEMEYLAELQWIALPLSLQKNIVKTQKNTAQARLHSSAYIR